MRILIIGFIVFVIWSLFSVWLYIEKIKPVADDPITIQPIPEIQPIVVDSVVQSDAIMPNDLMIYFEFDDASFNTDPKTDNSVIEFKSWLDKNPESILSITGHTDKVGTLEYNQALGHRRAQTIKKYLESTGINVDKLIAESKGEDQPVGDQSIEGGRAKNRRAVITIKK
jgi:outer membrane protein OmpA-like peptidoglycan-associated protein